MTRLAHFAVQSGGSNSGTPRTDALVDLQHGLIDAVGDGVAIVAMRLQLFAKHRPHIISGISDGDQVRLQTIQLCVNLVALGLEVVKLHKFFEFVVLEYRLSTPKHRDLVLERAQLPRVRNISTHELGLSTLGPKLDALDFTFDAIARALCVGSCTAHLIEVSPVVLDQNLGRGHGFRLSKPCQTSRYLRDRRVVALQVEKKWINRHVLYRSRGRNQPRITPRQGTSTGSGPGTNTGSDGALPPLGDVFLLVVGGVLKMPTLRPLRNAPRSGATKSSTANGSCAARM